MSQQFIEAVKPQFRWVSSKIHQLLWICF